MHECRSAKQLAAVIDQLLPVCTFTRLAEHQPAHLDRAHLTLDGEDVDAADQLATSSWWPGALGKFAFSYS